MRSFSALIICTTLSGVINISSAQDFENFQPEFRNESAGFDRPMQDIDLGESPEAPEELAIEIAGTKVAPDFKHRGLRITVPFDAAASLETGLELEPMQTDEAR